MKSGCLGNTTSFTGWSFVIFSKLWRRIKDDVSEGHRLCVISSCDDDVLHILESNQTQGSLEQCTGIIFSEPFHCFYFACLIWCLAWYLQRHQLFLQVHFLTGLERISPPCVRTLGRHVPGRLPSRCLGDSDPGNHSGLSAAALVLIEALLAGINVLDSPQEGRERGFDVIIIPCMCWVYCDGKERRDNGRKQKKIR